MQRGTAVAFEVGSHGQMTFLDCCEFDLSLPVDQPELVPAHRRRG